MKKVKKCFIISIFVVFVLSTVLFIVQHKELSRKYDEAVAYAEKGDFQEAYDEISLIGEYKDSDELLKQYENEINYAKVLEYIEKDKFADALPILNLLNSQDGGFKDSIELQYSTEYTNAMMLAAEGKIEEAFVAYRNLPSTYSDVQERLEEINYARKFIDDWYCKEHKIDMEIKGRIAEDNTTYLNVKIKDRNGFLLGDESNNLYGNDIVLMEDRFIWDMFENGTKYAVILEDRKIKFSKQPITEDDYIVSFVRKLENYNEVDGNINSAIDMNVDAGVK